MWSNVSVAFPIDAARVEPGFGPQWWSSGNRTRVSWTAGVVVCTLAVVNAVYQLRSGVGGPQVTLATHWSRQNSMLYLISAAGAA